MTQLKKHWYVILVLVLLVVGVIYQNVNKDGVDIDMTAYSMKADSDSVGSLSNVIVRQEMTRPMKRIKAVSFQSANYGNRSNYGTVHITVYNNDEMVGYTQIDASKISFDGAYLKVNLDQEYGEVGDTLATVIEMTDSDIEHDITLWQNQNSMAEKLNGSVTVGEYTYYGYLLNMKFECESVKLSSIWKYIFLLMLLIFFVSGKASSYYHKYLKDNDYKKKVNFVIKAFVLVAIGFIVFSLRDLTFISKPLIYGEDGTYLTNLFADGFIKSAFATRSGNSGDFLNTGSYILLFCSLRLSQMFHGYNLSHLPTYIGIMGNLFFAFVAFYGFYTFRKKGRTFALTTYLMILFVPMGITGSEVFGRVLNTVFMWPVLTIFVLYNQFDNRYTVSVRGILRGLLCIVAGLSFPLSYGPVGVYLVYGLILSIKEKRVKDFLLANITMMVTLGIGFRMLPTMAGAQGAAAECTYKASSLIEFALARHIIYPFIHFAYTRMNNIYVIVLFTIYMIIVLYGFYLSCKRDGFFSKFSCVSAMSALCIVGSIYMRVAMTSLFTNYTTTFPDRYYYGCNLLAILELLYACYIIFQVHPMKYLRNAYAIVVIVLLLMNKNLFQFTTPYLDSVCGNYYTGTWSESVKQGLARVDRGYTGNVKVNIYPMVTVEDNAWHMYIPFEYALASSDGNVR